MRDIYEKTFNFFHLFASRQLAQVQMVFQWVPICTLICSAREELCGQTHSANASTDWLPLDFLHIVHLTAFGTLKEYKLCTRPLRWWPPHILVRPTATPHTITAHLK